MGEVFLAWDSRLRRRVAIKRIRHDHGLNPAMRQRLLREARAVAGLSHPAVVQVYDLIEDATGDCILLEHVEGRTLAATLAESGRLEPETAVRLAGEIASGLAAAHAAGIVHRDLKAENVIVTPAGRAKILDFGLAQMSVRAPDDPVVTQHGVLLGTFHTMSPEQASGEEVDERSDLFSLGVVLYEMLTGRSPFRGSSPTETLRKVLSEHPPRVDGIRPGLPARLGDLVARLLAKEPTARPGSAAEVVRELETVAASLVSSGAPTLVASVSDLPTEVDVPRPAISQPVAPHPGAPGSTVGMSVLRRRGTKPAVLAVLAVVVLAVLGVLAARSFRAGQRPAPTKATVAAVAAAAPLRVVVPRPEVEGKDEKLGLAASGALSASLNTLASLAGVSPIDPVQLVGNPQSAIDMARIAGADEVLAVRLEASGDLGRVTLRRIHGADGRLIWSDTLDFDASLEPQALRLLADAVGIHLRRGYPDQHQRPGAFTPDVRDEDYAAYLTIKRRLDAGNFPSEADLTSLERIAVSSPRFLQACLQAADILLVRFQSTKEVAYRERALTWVRRARELAPDDPGPLLRQLKIELAGEQPQIARATLAKLDAVLPGDPQVLILRASLAEREGRMEEALVDMRRAVDHFPSWRNLTRLADLEARAGRIEDARQHLGKILAGSPENPWALDRLATIELLYGDLKQAERIYQALIARGPQAAHFANLGIVRIFLGRYEDAIAAFRQALALTPDDTVFTLNLAEAELALGRVQEADVHFRKVLREIGKNIPPGGLSALDSLTQAQCLAHLGQTQEAVEIAQRALGRSPDNGEVLEAAAQVYALVGDRASALVNVRGALAKGIQPRWFDLPGFASLRGDPELRRLLDQARGAHLL